MPPQNQNPYQPQPDQTPPPPLQPQPPASYVPQYGQPAAPLQPLPNQPQPHIDHKDFEFIMNPNQPKKKLPGGGNWLSNKLVLVAGGLLALVILLLVGSSLFSGGGVDSATMLKLAQQQNEIVRITGAAGAQQSASQRTKDLANSTSLVIASDQLKLTEYLTKNGVKLNQKQLALGQDAEADATLTAALTAGSYDSAFETILKDDLQTYSNDLATAYKSTEGPNLKKLLSEDYDNAQLLLKQLTSN